MAMTTCRECSRDVSDQASFCVGCGAPRPGKMFSPGRWGPKHGPGDGLFMRMLNELTQFAWIAAVLVLVWALWR